MTVLTDALAAPSLAEQPAVPVVDPAAADGVFGLLWVIIALPAAGAVVLLLLGGRRTNAWAHLLVAEGAVDGAIDTLGVTAWDLAAVQVIVEEAGGTFTDFAGKPRFDGGSAVSSNGHLHALLLAAVAGAPS